MASLRQNKVKGGVEKDEKKGYGSFRSCPRYHGDGSFGSGNSAVGMQFGQGPQTVAFAQLGQIKNIDHDIKNRVGIILCGCADPIFI